MPTFRKVPAEIAQVWDSSPARASRVADDRYTWVGRSAVIFLGGRPRSLSDTPRIGDVLRLRAPANTPVEQTTGVVLSVRTRQDGIWSHVELAVNGSTQLAAKSTIAAHLGRLKGITRVDQPTKTLNNRVHGGTHGWFVRIYEGKSPQIARTFSDRSAGGQVEALKAALAFHAAHVGLNIDEGIPFP
ncbi:MAG: hypothetical protein U0Z44_09745 [Kouleothrix sp.]|jgi:hypothetical protein|nr:hypothetical protein [Kouleothrix sp.]